MKKFLRKQLFENSLIMFNLSGVFRDLQNYFYSRKNIKKFKSKPFWTKLNLRYDWLGMPYTVLNYDDEFFEELDDTNQGRIILRDLALLLKEFSTFNSHEIIQMKTKRIKMNGEETNSLLIYFRPIFYYITFKNTFFTSLFGYIIYQNWNSIQTKLWSIVDAIQKL